MDEHEDRNGQEPNMGTGTIILLVILAFVAIIALGGISSYIECYKIHGHSCIGE
jgi:hypothetical protein